MYKSLPLLSVSGLLLFVIAGALVFHGDPSEALVVSLLGIGNILADIAFSFARR